MSKQQELRKIAREIREIKAELFMDKIKWDWIIETHDGGVIDSGFKHFPLNIEYLDYHWKDIGKKAHKEGINSRKVRGNTATLMTDSYVISISWETEKVGGTTRQTKPSPDGDKMMDSWVKKVYSLK